jgi:hypothetical protein
MGYSGEGGRGEIDRRGFLKLGFAGLLGAVVLFLSGCTNRDDRRRRRRRRS